MITGLVDAGLLPDAVLRLGVRRLIAVRARRLAGGGPEAARARSEAFLEAKRTGPVATHVDTANAQHYEVPPAFFEAVLGPRMKYSGALWHPAVVDLAGAETAMLDASLELAGVEDGHRVLDLGCGWGALSLRIAERFPRCEVVAVSNSRAQRAHIEARAAARGVERLTVLTQDVNAFAPPGTFDRVLSIEMFEHLWNHERLMTEIARVLRPGGRLFVHVFAHRETAYPFEDRGVSDWMARHFFTGGWMPSHGALAEARTPLRHEGGRFIDGTHYARTSRAWLARLDAARASLVPVLEAAYGAGEASRWHARWRAFFVACEELFGWQGGSVWGVSHHVFGRR